MTKMEDFNCKARYSKIGSQVPIKSSLYKHSREYDHRSWYREGDSDDATDPLHLNPSRGVVLGILFAIPLWLAIGALTWLSTCSGLL